MTPEVRAMRTQIMDMGRALDARELSDNLPNLRDYGWERHTEWLAALDSYHAETRRMREEREELAAEYFKARGF